MEEPSAPEIVPIAAIHPSVEKENNIITPEELDLLRETYSFPLSVQIKLFEENEIILSARPGEVAFYEASF